MTAPEPPEFSRIMAVGDVPAGGRRFRHAASDPEREALARRFQLVALEQLMVEGRLTPEPGGRFRLAAHMTAEVVHQCVVTLDPVRHHLDVTIERLYGIDVTDEWDDVTDSHNEIILSLDSEVTAEPLIGGRIDVGEAVAEQLGLEIDPFPRSPNAALGGNRNEGTSGDDQTEADASTPFARLANLKPRMIRSR